VLIRYAGALKRIRLNSRKMLLLSLQRLLVITRPNSQRLLKHSRSLDSRFQWRRFHDLR